MSGTPIGGLMQQLLCKALVGRHVWVLSQQEGSQMGVQF